MKRIQCIHMVQSKRLWKIEFGRHVYKTITSYMGPWTIYINDRIPTKEVVKTIRKKYIENSYFTEIDDVAKMFYSGQLSLSELISIKEDIVLCHGFNFLIEDIGQMHDSTISKKEYIDDGVLPERIFGIRLGQLEGGTPHEKMVKIIKEKIMNDYINDVKNYGEFKDD